MKKVYSADQISLAELQNGKYDDGRTFAPGHELRVTYDSPDQFKEYAKQLKLMDDKKVIKSFFFINIKGGRKMEIQL